MFRPRSPVLVLHHRGLHPSSFLYDRLPGSSALYVSGVGSGHRGIDPWRSGPLPNVCIPRCTFESCPATTTTLDPPLSQYLVPTPSVPS